MSEASIVVAAVDFRATTRRVVDTARELAESLGGTLLLVHVVPELKSLFGYYQGPKPVGTLQRELEDESSQQMEKLLEKLSGARTRVETGHAPSVVYRVCEQEDAAYLVIGAHNEDTPQARVLGGTADKILRDPPCPIVLVPGRD